MFILFIVISLAYNLSFWSFQEEPVDKTKHWGDLEEEEEGEEEEVEEEIEEEELEDGIQSVDSLSRYWVL